MMVAKPCEYTNNHHFKRVNFKICKFYLKEKKLNVLAPFQIYSLSYVHYFSN